MCCRFVELGRLGAIHFHEQNSELTATRGGKTVEVAPFCPVTRQNDGKWVRIRGAFC